jgi:ribonucleotide monophosphatase NagD (HAD superfamily)
MIKQLLIWRCDTDIKFGRDAGLSTLLVLTGVNSLADVERFATQGKDSLVADFFAPTLSHLLPP